MVGKVTRQRLLGAFVALLGGFGVRIADALPPPTSSLEQQAETEFAKADFAVRERLDREAAGDLIGARIAAHEAQLHRFRYLDLKRELNRLHPQPAASPSVAASRNPFIPDGSFLADSGASMTRAPLRPAVGPGEVTRTSYPSWDMYRSRPSLAGTGAGSPESLPAMRRTSVAISMGQTKDMYATDRAQRAVSDQPPPSMEPEVPIPSADPPRQPYLIYREQSAGPGTREWANFSRSKRFEDNGGLSK